MIGSYGRSICFVDPKFTDCYFITATIYSSRVANVSLNCWMT
ncbi:hypothetical protein CSIRO_3853 [Bradyrhizobiaceae bacterium SG-6C]|nr:hypothetical protein CSIRO_3853 [Bradyrhizobiaceae bacterium SG-6C]